MDYVKSYCIVKHILNGIHTYYEIYQVGFFTVYIMDSFVRSLNFIFAKERFIENCKHLIDSDIF